jgi:hypothetical protein
MGLMTMARDHRQANGQFKEEPGNDSVSQLLRFLRKLNRTLAHIPSFSAAFSYGSADMRVLLRHAALVAVFHVHPSSTAVSSWTHRTWLFPTRSCTCQSQSLCIWGCFQKTRSNIASLTGTGLGSWLWELQGRQLFHIRDWGADTVACDRVRRTGFASATHRV